MRIYVGRWILVTSILAFISAVGAVEAQVCHPVFHPCDERIFLPHAVQRPSPTPAPKPPAAPISLEGTPYQYLDASDRNLIVVGEVRNNTGGSVWFLKVVANLYDRSGLIGTEFTYAEPMVLPRSEKTCFRIGFDRSHEDTVRVDFQFDYHEIRTDLLPLIVIGDSGRYVKRYDDRHTYEIIGTVRNDHDTGLEFVQVVSTAYDASGVPVDCEWALANVSNIAPGETSSFKIEHWGYRRDFIDVRSYSLKSYGRPIDEP